VGRKDSGGTITTLSMLRAYCVHMQLASAPFTALGVPLLPVRDPPYHGLTLGGAALMGVM